MFSQSSGIIVTKDLFQSFWHNVQWIPELKHYAPGVPIVLVGTKLGKIFFLCSLNLVVICFLIGFGLFVVVDVCLGRAIISHFEILESII